MRLIGYIESEHAAKRFADYLAARGIESHIELEHGHGWGVWVRAEEHLDQAKQLLTAYKRDPSAPEFKPETRRAFSATIKPPRLALPKRSIQARWRALTDALAPVGLGPLTLCLILASVAVFVISDFGRNTIASVPGLFITHIERSGFDVLYRPGLVEIRQGQIWRLVTPIFIHFDLLHIFFNLFWLHDLGGMIETRLGAWRLARLVVVIAALSNVAEFVWTGPYFGGMSGVVYGLIGFLWMKSRYDPASGVVLHPWIVIMAGIWFLLCIAGVIQAANAAHAVGFATGTAWGYVSGKRRS
ncbi:MAG: rhomboid family intramembrane serine protease [Verrucomicrobiae bacterium]|nr:rhomboid family intramembrane serine protease [Verrucomicrobiae bacterium]MCX7721978.1 rhomboid family intramembrane serine protease [Verrucomicrobiae bacterium]MDW7980267.1 rhomboid family intramembrane serine protease [Verrucomicrobiales bacterium]